MKHPELIAKAEAIKQWALDNRMMGSGSAPADSNAEQRRHVRRTFSGEQSQVLQKKGLTAVGVSELNDSIVLYTNRALTIRENEQMPKSLFGDTKVHYRRASAFTLKDEIEDMHVGVSAGRFHKKRYACGASISIANRRTAGTLGCLVRDEDGTLFGLTNNHVTGGCNNTRVGMQVLAPGVRDITTNEFDPFTIGYHERVAAMRQGEPDAIDPRNNTDAAIFKVVSETKVSSSQSGHYDTPAATGEFVADPFDGTKVQKVGRTTNLTRGFIESRVVGPYSIDYDIPTYHNSSDMVRFRGRVYFDPVYLIKGNDGAFSSPGDSGALVVTNEEKPEAVGIIFAGNTSENTAYMLPLQPILESLKVRLESGHGS